MHVVDDPNRSRYELRDDGRLLGFTEYEPRGDGVLEFPHTVISESQRGAGYGSMLVRAALEDVRAKGLHIVPTCPFVARFVREHLDDADLLAP
jgi:predicted GNAT family acetyltransferase